MSNLDSLRQAIVESPENIPLLRLYADSCLDEFSLSEARGAYEKILKVRPNEPAARLGIARVLFMEGKTSEAIIRAETLIKDEPNFGQAYLFLSRLYLSENSFHAAVDFYQKALAQNKSLADAALEKELRPYRAEATEEKQPEYAGKLTSPLDWGGDEVDDYDDEPDIESEYETPGEFHLSDFERPRVAFSDVGGMEELKEEIRLKILYPMRNPELFRAYGKKIGGGILLYGPPGCGKTLISKATAGEIDANFFTLGLHQILDMYIGNSEKNLHQIFQLARENAPSVLFFDEVDALAADRKDLRHSAGRTVINQFLSEMDSTDGANEGVLIIGATNAPWHMDPAFRRPGRFDRILFVPPPDEEARTAIIEVLAREKPVADLDAAQLAKRTRNFSGADIKAVFDQATEIALSQAMREGRIVPITMKSLLAVAKNIIPSSRPWFESAKNYAMYANQSGFYDDVLKFLGIKKPQN